MLLRERLIHDIEKVRKDFEKCLNLSQEDIFCLELEDFYKRLADKKIQSLEETKNKGLELKKSLELLLVKMNRLGKNVNFNIESLFLLTSIINSQSEIIDQYWDYIPPSVRLVFTNLLEYFTNKNSSYTPRNEKTKKRSKNINLLGVIKLYAQIKFYKLFRSQDAIQEFELSLDRYVNSLKDAQARDIEDETDYQYALEMKKKSENEGTIDWKEL